MVVLMLSIGYGAEATPLKDQTEATEATEARSGYSPPNYANSYAGYHGASYGGYQKQPHYGNQGIHLVLDATCKR